MSGGKILYIFDAGDWQSRMPVARAARDAGFQVSIALIGDAPETSAHRDFNFILIPAPAGKLGAKDLPAMAKKIRRAIEAEKPDLIHAVTIKYAFIAGLAALPYPRLTKIYTLAGLGYLFHGEGAKAKLMRALAAPLLKFVLKAPGASLIFQNPDDMALMIHKKYADAARSFLVRGSGVDLDKFKPRASGAGRERPVVLMPTRLVREKGIHVFAEAADILKSQGVDAEFQIAGGVTRHNPSAISEAEMNQIAANGVVKWLGHVGDMPSLLAGADIVVYPSYYGEGIPRVLIEACAAGKPIITTDHPGCRETVINGENGILVPVRDAQATAQAIRALLEDASQRQKKGVASRQLAEKHFDIKVIAAKTIGVYKKSLGA